MTYTVLYRLDLPPPGADPVDVDLADYKPIAHVQALDLEALFRDMNAVDGTEKCCRLRVRSMTVGDVAIDLETGTAWYCEPAGWKSVTTRGAG